MLRVFFLTTAITAIAAAPVAARAQGTTGFAPGDLTQKIDRLSKPLKSFKAPPSPLTRLSSKAREWIAAETERQITSPRAPLDVALSINAELESDILRLAKRERINPDDISNAILLKIMYDAEGELRRRGATAEDLAQAQARLQETLEGQSQISRALAMM